MVVGAPQITSQPVFSIFLCFPLLSGTWRTPGLSLMSSSRLFFYLPCVLPPLTVPCKIVLARPDERETCPYLFSLMITSSWLQTHWFWSAQPFYSPKAIKQKKNLISQWLCYTKPATAIWDRLFFTEVVIDPVTKQMDSLHSTLRFYRHSFSSVGSDSHGISQG